MSTPGKKYIVLAPETFEMLTRKQQEVIKNIENDNTDEQYISRKNKINELMQPPEKLAMYNASQEMKNVWSRPELGEDEKVKQYTNAMNTFNSFHKSLTSSKPIEMKVVGEDSVDKDNLMSPAIAANASPATASAGAHSKELSNVDDKDLIKKRYNITQNLPKAMKKTGILLENRLQQHPDKVSWNSRGELNYRGETLAGSNITDLFKNIFTKTGKNDKYKYLKRICHCKAFSCIPETKKQNSLKIPFSTSFFSKLSTKTTKQKNVQHIIVKM